MKRNKLQAFTDSVTRKSVEFNENPIDNLEVAEIKLIKRFLNPMNLRREKGLITGVILRN